MYESYDEDPWRGTMDFKSIRNCNLGKRETKKERKRKSLVTLLRKHGREVHGGNDFNVNCKILEYEAKTSARKTLEAFYISARNPEMIDKNEHLAILMRAIRSAEITHAWLLTPVKLSKPHSLSVSGLLSS
ncbi:hypothetical protein Y032_0010g1220 [Ancylostoma ceylanicum]|uniref:Uncharacterized protein n=1 Tax=Ancylostoma ceylanicum TaxID=53326 RepID=A0A016VH20_9BILA|nr:hypothetical protein Y032_0010g1220 [Ancylostoma ceylanicum]